MEGCANIGNKEEIKNNQVHSKEKLTIRPNVVSKEIDNLIKSLGRLSSGTGTQQDTKSEIQIHAHNVLAGNDLDPIQAVVISLSSVGAVYDKYGRDPDQQVECMLFVIILRYRLCRLFIAH